MAVVEDGVALLNFGTTTVTGYVIEGVSETESGDDIEIQDESGDVITHLNNFNLRTTMDLSVIPKSGTATPAIGDTFTYSSATHGAGTKITILEISSQEVNKDVTRWNIKGVLFPGVSIT